MSSPYRLWEIQERSNTGPFCEENDFLPKIFTPKLKEVIKKYQIKYDPKTPVPSDDALADRVWQAAWELYREVGLYNTDTHRIIKVSDQEIKEALYMHPGQYWVGAGKAYKEFDYDLNENHRIVHYGRSATAYLTDVLARHAREYIARAAKPADTPRQGIAASRRRAHPCF